MKLIERNARSRRPSLSYVVGGGMFFEILQPDMGFWEINAFLFKGSWDMQVFKLGSALRSPDSKEDRQTGYPERH